MAVMLLIIVLVLVISHAQPHSQASLHHHPHSHHDWMTHSHQDHSIEDTTQLYQDYQHSYDHIPDHSPVTQQYFQHIDASQQSNHQQQYIHSNSIHDDYDIQQHDEEITLRGSYHIDEYDHQDQILLNHEMKAEEDHLQTLENHDRSQHINELLEHDITEDMSVLEPSEVDIHPMSKSISESEHADVTVVDVDIEEDDTTEKEDDQTESTVHFQDTQQNNDIEVADDIVDASNSQSNIDEQMTDEDDLDSLYEENIESPTLDHKKVDSIEEAQNNQREKENEIREYNSGNINELIPEDLNDQTGLQDVSKDDDVEISEETTSSIHEESLETTQDKEILQSETGASQYSDIIDDGESDIFDGDQSDVVEDDQLDVVDDDEFGVVDDSGDSDASEQKPESAEEVKVEISENKDDYQEGTKFEVYDKSFIALQLDKQIERLKDISGLHSQLRERFNTLNDHVDSIYNKYQEVTEAQKKIREEVDSFGADVSELKSGLLKSLVSFGAFHGNVKGFIMNSYAASKSFVMEVISKFDALADVKSILSSTSERTKSQFSEIKSDILIPIAMNLVKQVDSVLDELEDRLREFGKTLDPSIEQLRQHLRDEKFDRVIDVNFWISFRSLMLFVVSMAFLVIFMMFRCCAAALKL